MDVTIVFDPNISAHIFTDSNAFYGRVEKCTVVLDRDRRPRGFAFVTFDTVDSAAECRDRMNGKEIDGREVQKF